MCKLQRSYNETDKISRTPARLVEFQSGTQICRAGNSAGQAACESAHLFTLHPASESDPAPVLPVCVQTPVNCNAVVGAQRGEWRYNSTHS